MKRITNLLSRGDAYCKIVDILLNTNGKFQLRGIMYNIQEQELVDCFFPTKHKCDYILSNPNRRNLKFNIIILKPPHVNPSQCELYVIYIRKLCFFVILMFKCWVVEDHKPLICILLSISPTFNSSYMKISNMFRGLCKMSLTSFSPSHIFIEGQSTLWIKISMVARFFYITKWHSTLSLIYTYYGKIIFVKAVI